jgi:hypothetical protein
VKHLQKVVSTMMLFIFLSTGCGTNIDSINYNGGEESGISATLDVVKEGDNMRFELSLTNETEETALLQFPSGQQFEIIVKDENNHVVYRYSEGKMFTMAIVMKEIKPKETLIWEDEWKDATPGTYTVIGELQIMSINGESVDRGQFTVEKTIRYEK